MLCSPSKVSGTSLCMTQGGLHFRPVCIDGEGGGRGRTNPPVQMAKSPDFMPQALTFPPKYRPRMQESAFQRPTIANFS